MVSRFFPTSVPSVPGTATSEHQEGNFPDRSEQTLSASASSAATPAPSATPRASSSVSGNDSAEPPLDSAKLGGDLVGRQLEAADEIDRVVDEVAGLRADRSAELVGPAAGFEQPHLRLSPAAGR